MAHGAEAGGGSGADVDEDIGFTEGSPCRGRLCTSGTLGAGHELYKVIYNVSYIMDHGPS